MGRCLGIDTSNYTTSAAIYDGASGNMIWKKKLLPVKEGTIGLRSTEVVFAHIKQISEIVKEVFSEFGEIDAVAVSDRPRDAEGSYMPCFLVGKAVAESVAVSHNVKLYGFSHQVGHIASALWSSGRNDLFDKEFLSFHISGGTTECLFVKPDKERGFAADIVGETRDLNMGQLIDRVGVMMGCSFPAGAEMEKLAKENGSAEKIAFDLGRSVKEGNCSISGLENKCRELFSKGHPKEEIAASLFYSVGRVMEKMTDSAFEKCGEKEIVYAGGVMSNGIIRDMLSKKYRCVFAGKEFSSDNACGIAFLGARADSKARGKN